jgi:hypothetical protein
MVIIIIIISFIYMLQIEHCWMQCTLLPALQIACHDSSQIAALVVHHFEIAGICADQCAGAFV